jgi:acyl-coenzyme A thioesterase PaaI-like protein
VLAKLGPVALAVTTSMHIDFLRRAELASIVAKAELLKLGKTLAVGRVTITTVGDPRPIAHASLTYSLPPR